MSYDINRYRVIFKKHLKRYKRLLYMYEVDELIHEHWIVRQKWNQSVEHFLIDKLRSIYGKKGEYGYRQIYQLDDEYDEIGDDDMDYAETLPRVYFKGLSEEKIRLLRMKFEDDLSYKQIADRLGMKEATAYLKFKKLYKRIKLIHKFDN